ncbi:radical SAM protein [Bradyrhizobium sp. WSM471]|uniref:radical SAM protein n=1 Tax=Bradyrhizobium sp. WSM471 TaxID=319017 RepID=UPI00024D1BAD|nr:MULTISPECIES: 4Fe-4S cluster-binding domain-containing protein [Bradyrhizobium]EHR00265.1 arylsulfatase regulator (Fe-S oxidoreductase) [Bradyrhizobium sp. WSM471]UFW42380.1 4Fe-4S cluster-binding domain-containing protein [Bradyrhizobium canariense]
MARFLSPETFRAATEDLSLLPFNFERIGEGQCLVANMIGDFIRLTEDELSRLVDLRVRPGDGLYERAYAAHLVTGANQKAQRQLLAARLRSRMSFLQQMTPLHIFVVTLRCEHSCPYCQVSRQSTDRSRFDMSQETAMRALDIAFASPSARIKIEFQGGEPLLNFPLIKTIIQARHHGMHHLIREPDRRGVEVIGIPDRTAAQDQLVIIRIIELPHLGIEGMALSGYATDDHAVDLFVASDVGESRVSAQHAATAHTHDATVQHAAGTILAFVQSVEHPPVSAIARCNLAGQRVREKQYPSAARLVA